MSNPTLFYFPVRGRAELIRLILAEAGLEYAEHPIGKDTPPLHGRPTDFAALKASGLLAFEAVPLWEEADGFRLAQSLAIANHLARQHGLMGKTQREHAQVEQALGGYEDARMELRKVATAAPAQRSELREEFVTVVAPRWLGYFEKLLRANRDATGFLVGDALSSADLALWYFVETLEDNGMGAAMAKAPLVAAHFARIGKRPQIAAYVSSPRRHAFMTMPK